MREAYSKVVLAWTGSLERLDPTPKRVGERWVHCVAV